MPVCHKLNRSSVVALAKYIHVFYKLYAYYKSILSVYETASTEFLQLSRSSAGLRIATSFLKVRQFMQCFR